MWFWLGGGAVKVGEMTRLIRLRRTIHRKLGRPDGALGLNLLGHREYVGGLWEVIGKLQFDFLISRGLKPEHVFLDIACGPLRGGAARTVPGSGQLPGDREGGNPSQNGDRKRTWPRTIPEQGVRVCDFANLRVREVQQE